MLRFPLGLLFALSSFAQVEIAVHINNTAAVPPNQVHQAMKIAMRVFQPLGIAMRWTICDPVCAAPGTIPTFILGLAGPQLEMPRPAAFSFAMLATGLGNRAAVSLPRITDFAEANNVAVESVLAYSIAHELGHMIMKSKGHSDGVMRAKWDRENAMRMGQIRLEFTSKDAAAIQAALRGRLNKTAAWE